ncbi:MAG: hypothetical protein HN350_05605 [Phycisphaerales bacterium]|nr:hypothetical protein [Phycisphaerales bacterium]
MQKTAICMLATAIAVIINVSVVTGAAPTSGPSDKALLGAVMFPKIALAAKDPAAIIIEPNDATAERFVLKWRNDLIKTGFCVFLTKAPKKGWTAADGLKLIKEFDEKVVKGNAGKLPAMRRKVDARRILLISPRQGGPASIAIIEKHPERVAGAVLVAVSPWVHSTDTIKLWRPSKAAWKVPIWAAMPVDIQTGSPTLLLWRKLSSDKPAGAMLTIDPRIQHGDTEPDDSIDKWISAVAGGKTPPIGPDSLVVRETKRYQGSAKSLMAAMQTTRAADAGMRFSKIEGPMEMDITAPAKWKRAERGERKYDPINRAYVQIYVSPKPGGLLFARANAAKWGGEATGLLDQYEQRLKDGGYQLIRYARWNSKGYALQITSVLWPSKGKWHRWLVLVAAGPGKAKAPAAPLVTVMDASDTPDTNAMAAAMKRILPGVSVVWKGEPAKKTVTRRN